MANETKFYVHHKGTVMTAPHATAGDAWVDTIPTFYNAKQIAVDQLTLGHPEKQQIRNRPRASGLDASFIAYGAEGAGDWTLKCTLSPSGTAGTAPDIQDILECAFGTETLVPVTSATYSFSYTDDEYLRAFAMYYTADGGGQGHVYAGCIVEKITITAKANDVVKFEASGKFLKHQHYSQSKLLAAIVAVDATSMTLSDATLGAIWGTDVAETGKCYLPVKIDTEVVIITKWVAATHTATITRAQYGTSGATHLIDAEVLAWQPTESVNYNPISTENSANTLTVGGTAYDFLDFSYTVDCGNEPIPQVERGQTSLRHVRKKEISVAIEFTTLWDNKDKRDLLSLSYNKAAAIATTMVLGGTAGKICTLALPQGYIETKTPPAMPDLLPEQETVVGFTIKGHASAATTTDTSTVAFT